MRRSMSPLTRLALTLGLALVLAAGTVLLPGRAGVYGTPSGGWGVQDISVPRPDTVGPAPAVPGR